MGSLMTAARRYPVASRPAAPPSIHLGLTVRRRSASPDVPQDDAPRRVREERRRRELHADAREIIVRARPRRGPTLDIRRLLDARRRLGPLGVDVEPEERETDRDRLASKVAARSAARW